jgi:hypothetical protein
MEVNSAYIQELIQQPQESLSVELKDWIDPGQPEGIAKIVKTALAMRNRGGGYMVFGFNNKTLEPNLDDAPSDVRELFHIDKIQGMIAKYSSEPFEVTVEFPQRDGQDFPVIIVPTDIKTPVVAKSDLLSKSSETSDKALIRADTVYVRSLSSNNTASTTQAKSKDWPQLIEVCFDNREADIARFIRRHLGSIGAEQLNALATVFAGKFEPEVFSEDILRAYFQESEKCFELKLKDRKASLPEHGVWEVGLILKGDVPHHSTNQEFLNLLSSSNPAYTGWPVWLDSRRFGENDHPYVIYGVWEALVLSRNTEFLNLMDFMRLDPKGKFFLRRDLGYDMGISVHASQVLADLDFSFPIIRTAEAIAVGIAFAKSMGCLPEETTLAFAFKWTKLKGRKLSSWVNRSVWIPQHTSAYQDEVIAFVNVPLDMPLSVLSQYVNQVVKPLFEIFDGFTLSEDIVEDITRRLIERRR